MRINKQGHLLVGGCDAVKLARQFGTPLYVLDEDIIRKKCQEYKSSFAKYYPSFDIAYAGKANLSKGICQIIKEEEKSLDASSGGEIWTAKKAKFPMVNIYFHGNNKSREEIKLAIKSGVGRIVVDNEYELQNVNNICQELKKEVNILVRVTPNVKPSTHAHIQTGQIDSKFGVPLGDAALNFLKKSLKYKNIKLKGLHCHIGSQILSTDPFKVAAEVMVKFTKEIKDKLRWELEELNLGGGLGIVYTKEKPPTIDEYVKAITQTVLENCQTLHLKIPKIIIEPGRSIVGEAGTTLYTVGAIKEIPGIRKYVMIDGGICDNPRPALYKSVYQAVVANKIKSKLSEVVSIAGKCCESGDMLIWDIKLTEVKPGDILAVFSTGAYNYSMASNYNRLPKPATVLVSKGSAEVIIKRESYDDVIRCDV